MIRKVRSDEEGEVLKYLALEPEFTLFILGDIQNFGFQTDFSEIWAQSLPGHKLAAVILRYFCSYILYAQGHESSKEIIEFLTQREDMRILSGKDEAISPLLSELPQLQAGRRMYFARMDRLREGQIDPKAPLWQVTKASISDVGRIAAFRATITEFKESNQALTGQSLKMSLEGGGRCYYIQKGDEIVASAQTTAESDFAAMIVSVATAPQYRRQGLATACLSQLCRDVLAEGKSLCLFYDNPLAGEVYRKLGFQNIGYWRMAYRD